MNTADILDVELEPLDERLILESIKWWERRRLSYIVLVGGLQVVMMIWYWKSTLIFGLWSAIFGSIGHLIIANCFYCIGWGLEVLAIYYKLSGIETFMRNVRIMFYVAGILLSIFITFVFYYLELYPLLS